VWPNFYRTHKASFRNLFRSRGFQRLFEKKTASSMPIFERESVLTYKKRLITKGLARNHQKHKITTGLERYCKGEIVSM